MRILIATDAWHPQVNGVVRTLAMMAEAASPLGAALILAESLVGGAGTAESGVSAVDGVRARAERHGQGRAAVGR